LRPLALVPVLALELVPVLALVPEGKW